MMPRQHNKTKKYDVVIKKRKSNLNCNKVSQMKKDVIHINEIINSTLTTNSVDDVPVLDPKKMFITPFIISA